MVIFAICLVIVIVWLFKVGGESIGDRLRNASFQQGVNNRNNFVNSITATPEQVEWAEHTMDCSDVLEEMQEVAPELPLTLDSLNAKFKYRSKYFDQLNWYHMIVRIRLAKMGKTKNNYLYECDTLVAARSESLEKTMRFYTVLARCFTEAGVPMQAREYNQMDVDPFTKKYKPGVMSEVNLDRFRYR